MVELSNKVLQAYHEEASHDSGLTFSSVVAAMNEGQLITLLKDRSGIILCGNVPGAELTRQTSVQSVGQCIIYILEKSPKDRQGTEWEFDRFSVLQHLMSKLCEILLGADAFSMLCQSGMMRVDTLNVEAEYNIYGGFNGWSVTFRLPDGKGAGLS